MTTKAQRKAIVDEKVSAEKARIFKYLPNYIKEVVYLKKYLEKISGQIDATWKKHWVSPQKENMPSKSIINNLKLCIWSLNNIKSDVEYEICKANKAKERSIFLALINLLDVRMNSCEKLLVNHQSKKEVFSEKEIVKTINRADQQLNKTVKGALR